MNEIELEQLTKTVSNLNDEDLTTLLYTLLGENRIYFPYAYTKEHIEKETEREILDEDFNILCNDTANYYFHFEFINAFLDNLEAEREFEEEEEEEEVFIEN